MAFPLKPNKPLDPRGSYQPWGNSHIHENALLHAFSLPDKVFFGDTSCSIDFSFTFSSVPISFFLFFFLSSLPRPNCLSVVRPSISPVYSVVIQDNMFQHLPLHMMPDPRHWPSLYHTAHTHLISLTHPPFPLPLTSFRPISLFLWLSFLNDHPSKYLSGTSAFSPLSLISLSYRDDCTFLFFFSFSALSLSSSVHLCDMDDINDIKGQ